MTTQTEDRAPVDTDGNDIHNPFFARLYHYVFARGEGKRMQRCRDELVAGLTGRVVEVGPGSGVNFSHYPETVREVIVMQAAPVEPPLPYILGRGVPQS